MSEHEPPDRAELLPDTVEDKPLFLIVKKWLELEGLSFDLLDPMTDIAEPQTTLRLPIQGRIGKWICILRILEKTERIVVYSVLPDKAEDDHQRHRLYELLSWFNYGLILGNFEIDPRDGEVRYKTSMDVEGVTVGDALLRNLLFSNFFSMDRYWDAIYEGIDTQRDLMDIVFDAESNSDPENALMVQDQHVH